MPETPGAAGLFSVAPDRYTKLSITQLILAIILLAVSLPLGWMILIVMSGLLVG